MRKTKIMFTIFVVWCMVNLLFLGCSRRGSRPESKENAPKAAAQIVINTPADDTELEDLKGPGLPKGSTLKSTNKLLIENAAVTYKSGWRRFSGTISCVAKEISEMEILESFKSEVPKIKIYYLHVSDSEKMTIEGETTKEDTFGPLNGETAIFEFRKDRWEFDKIGGLYNPEQIKELEQACEELSADFYPCYFYPDKKVRPGESWIVEGSKLKKYFGLFDIKTDKISIKCTFDKVVTYSSQRCALILDDMKISGRMIDDDNNELDITMELSGITYRSLESFIDIRYEGEGIMKCSGMITTELGEMEGTLKGKVRFFGEVAISDRPIFSND